MKRLFIAAILFLVPTILWAQTDNRSPYYRVWGPILINTQGYYDLSDTAYFALEVKDTTKAVRLSGNDTTGIPPLARTITWNASDSSFYYGDGVEWRKLTGSGSGQIFQQLSLSGDTLTISYGNNVVLNYQNLDSLKINAILNQDSIKQTAVSRYVKNIVDTITNQISASYPLDFRNGSNYLQWDGQRLMPVNSSGGINIGIGAGSSSSAPASIFIGTSTGEHASGKASNIILGDYAFAYGNGAGNVAMGYKALQLDTGNYSFAGGLLSGSYSQGIGNTFSGGYAGYLSTGDSSIYIGYNSGTDPNVQDTIYQADHFQTTFNGIASIGLHGTSIDSLINNFNLKDSVNYPFQIVWITPVPVIAGDSSVSFTRTLTVKGDTIYVLFTNKIITTDPVSFIMILNSRRINNNIVIGAGAEADSSNQIILGNGTTTTFKLGGSGKMNFATNLKYGNEQVIQWDSAKNKFVPGTGSAFDSTSLSKRIDSKIDTSVDHTFTLGTSNITQNNYFKQYSNIMGLPLNEYVYKSGDLLHIGLNYPNYKSAEYVLYRGDAGPDSIFILYGGFVGSTISKKSIDLDGTFVFNGSNPNVYTTTVGDKFTFNFDGPSFYFNYYANNQGGLWKFKCGDDSVNVSTYSSVISSDNTIELFNAVGGTSKLVTATFMGSDPNNPVTTPRGWIKYDSLNNTTISALSRNGVMGQLDKKEIMYQGSVCEFALSMAPALSGVNLQASWIPYHGAAGSVRNVTAYLTSDRFNINPFSMGSDTLSGLNNVTLHQIFTGYNTNDTSGLYPEFGINLIHSFNGSSGQMTISNKFNVLDTVAGVGYLSMPIVQLNTLNKFIYGDSTLTGEIPDTLIDQYLNYYRNSGLFISDSNNYFMAFKTNFIDNSLMKTPIQERVFWERRPGGLGKFYTNISRNVLDTLYPGKTYASSTSYVIGEVDTMRYFNDGNNDFISLSDSLDSYVTPTALQDSIRNNSNFSVKGSNGLHNENDTTVYLGGDLTQNTSISGSNTYSLNLSPAFLNIGNASPSQTSAKMAVSVDSTASGPNTALGAYYTGTDPLLSNAWGYNALYAVGSVKFTADPVSTSQYTFLAPILGKFTIPESTASHYINSSASPVSSFAALLNSENGNIGMSDFAFFYGGNNTLDPVKNTYTGHIDTLYGLFVTDPFAGQMGDSIRRAYGIYLGGSATYNYLAGHSGFGINTPTSAIDINGTSTDTGADLLRIRKSYTPTGSDDAAGQVGSWAWDDSYIYVKTSSGWKRAALTTF